VTRTLWPGFGREHSRTSPYFERDKSYTRVTTTKSMEPLIFRFPPPESLRVVFVGMSMCARFIFSVSRTPAFFPHFTFVYIVCLTRAVDVGIGQKVPLMSSNNTAFYRNSSTFFVYFHYLVTFRGCVRITRTCLVLLCVKCNKPMCVE
jgi:hypothetical protein